MEVINDLMGYEGLKIIQDPELFSFSLDSHLLANFATINVKCQNICDLCTGNAPIPMYLTLRTKAKITGVELQEKSYDLAKRSVELNNLTNQISLVNRNLKDSYLELGFQKFDLVTCNPPYFKAAPNSNYNKNDYKTIARHEVTITLEEIIKEAFNLLNNKGYFAMVHRPERLVEILELMHKYKLEPKRLRFVYPKKDGECNHILIEGIKNGNPGLKVLNPLIIFDENNKWTEEVLKIYNYKEECLCF